MGDWVDEILTPQLENGEPKFQISVVSKDDGCGSTQVQQLLLKMRASEKTIVVLSNDFVSSPQCQYVLSFVEQWNYDFRRNSCILVLHEDEASLSGMIYQNRRRNPY